jgi:PD-(D/E)XK nuclease superfamily
MPESYSVNQLKTWEKCRKKYEFDYERQLMWPSNPKNFRLGKGVHQLLDYESRGLSLEPILSSVDSDIEQAWRLLSQCPWATLPVIASEWGFSLAIEQNWLYGRIDRIVRDGETIRILDWKTGTGVPAIPATDWQTVIYLYAVYEARRDLGLSITPEQLVFTYVQVKGTALKEISVSYNTEFHQEVGQRLSETLKQIRLTKHFPLPSACPDHFCPYSNICGIRDVDGEDRGINQRTLQQQMTLEEMH